MSSEVVAGVDIGSSSARAIAVDRDGVIVATTVARYDQSDGLPVGEVDPAVWLDGLAAAVGQLECELPAALCVGGHGPTTVASTGQLALTFRHPAGATSGPVEQHVAQTAVLQERFGDHVEPRQSWDFLISQLGGDPTVQSVWPASRVLAMRYLLAPTWERVTARTAYRKESRWSLGPTTPT